MTVLAKIQALLDAAGIPYRLIEHEETRTSEESARARGEELRVDGKALLVKADDGFHIAVLSADRKLDSRATSPSRRVAGNTRRKGFARGRWAMTRRS